MRGYVYVLPILTALAAAGVVRAAGDAAAAENDNWPQWRGPSGDGYADANPPSEFGRDKNVKWKAAIPGRGMATPIVWGDRVFVATAVPKTDDEPNAAAETTGEPSSQAPQRGQRQRGGGGGGMRGGGASLVEQQFQLICLNRDNGEVLWTRTCRESMPHEGHHPQYGSFASATPVTDGERVYAFFGSYGLYCFDMDGAPVWDRDFDMQARVFNQFGEGTSPALHGDTLVVKTDHNDGSFIAALNKLTGEVIWRQDRQDNRSWSAPAIVETEGRALVVISGNRTALAYDLKTGETVWSAQPQGGNAIPSAVANGELVFYKGGGQRGGGFQAVKLNAGGDLTAAPEAIAWSLPSVPTSVSSPLLVGSELYIVGDNGVVSCYNATTGEAHYQNQRLPGAYNFKSSPVCAGDRIYLAMEQGDVVVLKRGPTFEVLATVSMGEMLIASPAVAGSELFIRTQTELFCFRQGERSDRTGRLDAQRSRR